MDPLPPSAPPEQTAATSTDAVSQAVQPTQQNSGPAPSTHMARQPGLRPIPDYELVEQLGEGGFGEVWRAKGPGGISVAMKFIRLSDKTMTEVRAFEVMKDIRHPQLLSVFGAWQVDGWLILAMELADRTLFDRLVEATRQGLPGIPRLELLDAMRDAARGIDYLNSINVRHRDIKPQNFLLVGGGVKVADFGLAKLVEKDLASNSGAMTPAYAAPEFLQSQTSDRSDQYSLAVSYCQLRGGRLPFEGHQAAVMLGHLHEAPDLTMVPTAERPVVARALSKKPEDRWLSCKEFVEALAATPEQQVRPISLPAGMDAPATRFHVNAGPTEWPAPAGRPGPILASAFLVVALAPLALWLWPQPATEDVDLSPAEAESQSPGPANLPATVSNSLGMRLALIRQGNFTMGVSSAERSVRADDGPAHEVRLTQPFYLGEFEVTQGQYEAVMGVNPSHFTDANGGGADHPVDRVSWEDAVLFCKRLSARSEERGRTYRLPTEAEWEYACRAGSKTAFSFGDAASSREANFNGAFPFGQATPGTSSSHTSKVGDYPPNRWKLCDMHGNVREWCADWSGPYDPEGQFQVDPRGPRRGYGRVVRGGSWDSYGWACRSSSRACLPPSSKANDLGFRVAMSLASSP